MSLIHTSAAVRETLVGFNADNGTYEDMQYGETFELGLAGFKPWGVRGTIAEAAAQTDELRGFAVRDAVRATIDPKAASEAAATAMSIAAGILAADDLDTEVTATFARLDELGLADYVGHPVFVSALLDGFTARAHRDAATARRAMVAALTSDRRFYDAVRFAPAKPRNGQPHVFGSFTTLLAALLDGVRPGVAGTVVTVLARDLVSLELTRYLSDFEVANGLRHHLRRHFAVVTEAKRTKVLETLAVELPTERTLPNGSTATVVFTSMVADMAAEKPRTKAPQATAQGKPAPKGKGRNTRRGRQAAR